MKKSRTKQVFLYVLSCIIVIVSAGCSKKSSSAGPEKLIQDYLQAVQNEDYEAIWNMIPEEIQEYAVRVEIIPDKEAGLDFIKTAVNNYYWLAEANLPEQKEVRFEITESGELDKDSAQEYCTENLSRVGLSISIEKAAGSEIAITLDNGEEVEATLYMIQTGGNWYFISVTGDDELFKY